MQIVTLGMHRSGTSAITRLINLMGAYIGPEGCDPGLTEANPKGYWERRDVFMLNESLLKSKSCAWNLLSQWRFSSNLEVPPPIADSIRKIIVGMDQFRPWVLKDPRLCLLFPAWQQFMEVPILVLVHRDPIEVALSLQVRDQLPLEYGLALWEYYTVGALNASYQLPRLYISHADLMQEPVKTCEILYQQLCQAGVRRIEMPSTREIKAFIEPELYRAKAEHADNIALSSQQRMLVDMLKGLQPQQNMVQASETSRSTISKGL